MLPHVTDFHTTKGFEHSWHGVDVIELDDMPKLIRNLRIVKDLLLKGEPR